MQTTYFNNFCFGKLGLVMSLAKKSWAWMSSLFAHILEVIFLRSEKKMIRITAGRIIAMMADVYTFRNWATKKFPRKSMRCGGNALSQSRDANFAVTMDIYTASPEPTCIGFVDSAHQALKEWFGFWSLHGAKNIEVRLIGQPAI